MKRGYFMGLLEGKVAIVTGGGSGIGKGIAKIFSQENCAVVIAGRNKNRLSATSAELMQNRGEVVSIPTDVTRTEQVDQLFEKTIERFGRLDILVNNAGAFGGGRIDKIADETWHRIIATTINGTFFCSRKAFKIMKDSGGGRIINIGSVAAYRPREHSAPYSTGKAAIASLTHCIALDGREFGITASCLNPGNTLVERRADGRPGTGRDEGAEAMITVEDIARTVLLMATLSPDANLLEAVVLPIKMKYIGRG